MPVALDVASKREVIVPTKALNQILRLAPDAEEEGVQVKLDEDHVIFRFDKTALFTRLIEGPFPKYQDVIPSQVVDAASTGRLVSKSYASHLHTPRVSEGS